MAYRILVPWPGIEPGDVLMDVAEKTQYFSTWESTQYIFKN